MHADRRPAALHLWRVGGGPALAGGALMSRIEPYHSYVSKVYHTCTTSTEGSAIGRAVRLLGTGDKPLCHECWQRTESQTC